MVFKGSVLSPTFVTEAVKVDLKKMSFRVAIVKIIKATTKTKVRKADFLLA